MKKKIIVIVRDDIKISDGKLGVQVSHAMMGLVLLKSKKVDDKRSLLIERDIYNYIHEDNDPVLLKVDSEKDLLGVYNRLREKKIDAVHIIDNGLTEFNGIKTPTCVATGLIELDCFIDIVGVLEKY